MLRENTIPETGVVFVGLARECLEATYEPLRLLDSVAQASECSLVDDPQVAVLRKQISRVHSLINCALQVLSMLSRTKHVWYSEHGTYYQFEFILERAMSATHIAVILCTRTSPAYEEEFMKMDYPDARNEYSMS